MSFLPNLTAVGDALGWAVLHSFWQGALAAILVWAFRAITRESAADSRYMFGFLTLCTLFAAFIGTFIYYFNTAVTAATTGTAPAEAINTVAPAALSASSNPLLTVTSHTTTIGSLWALCFIVLATRYLAAFRLTHKLRTTGTSPLPSNWQTRFVTLAEQSGANDKVRGFISEHVASPVTFGFFKPVVLVPAWFFTGLSAEQCEAVLLHELAHIRRHDFLTNIFQIIIKTVFFYHPAVQYICKHINTDREHACDDFAIKLTQNPEGLATALGTIRIKAARNAGVFAQVGILGADGPDAPIMHRLKRLMGASNTVRTNGTARGFAATGMLFITAGLVLTLGASQSLAHPVSAEELAGKANSGLSITGDGYKVVGNTYYLKNRNGYSSGKQMAKAYSYSFEKKNGKTFAIRTDSNGNKTLEDGTPYSSKKSKNKNKNINKNVNKNVNKNTNEKSNYSYGSYKVNGKKYKTKVDPKNNQTYIKVDGSWYDFDDTDLDALLGNMPVPPLPPLNKSTPIAPLAPTQNANWDTDIKQQWEREFSETEKGWREAEQERRADQKELEAHKRELVHAQDVQHKDSAKRIEKIAKKEAKARAKGDTKRAQGYANDRRDLEREHRELVQEHHADLREWEQDVRETEREWKREMLEAKQEWAQEVREARLEHAEEKREREYEIRERNRDREQSKRDLEQHARDLRQRERDIQQRKRDEDQKVRDEKHRKEDIKRQASYEKMRKKLITVLKKDGFIKSESQKVVIDVNGDDITINGQALDGQKEDKYGAIIAKYIKSDDQTKRIVFKPGYMHIKTGGRNNHTYSYTHNE